MAGIGLYIQLLQRQSHKVCAVAYLAAAQSERGTFSAADVQNLFDTLRVPAPSNVHAHLSNLANADTLLRTPQGPWSFTPVGQERAVAILGEESPAALQALNAEGNRGGALLGEALHPVIPPGFAPPRWREGIGRLLDRFPFSSNVFCMTRFPDAEGNLPDPVRRAVNAIRGVCEEHSLVLHLASDRIVDGELFGNVGAHMWACQYGIGILEDRIGEGLNYNVMTELGAMLVTGRRCAILKDSTIANVPSDLAGHVYKPIDLADLEQVSSEAARWITEDLAL